MDYTNMMKDCISYINRHAGSELTAEKIGEIQSLRGEFLSFLFSCYYRDYLDSFLGEVKEHKIKYGFRDYIEPRARLIQTDLIKVEYKTIDGFMIEAVPVVTEKEQIYRPVETFLEQYKKEGKQGEPHIGLWWHDEEYRCHYMQGSLYCRESQEDREDTTVIRIPGGEYAVFSMPDAKGKDLAEQLKCLVHYGHKKWLANHLEAEDELGYNFQCVLDGRAYYLIALQEPEKRGPEDKVYGVETWIDYIDEHLNSNLTVTSLAKTFHYSTTHFKRIFRLYYKMAVSDYIRKRKLEIIAEAIRDGSDYMELSSEYGFKTYTGFARAFKKEFHVSPAVYSRGLFEVIDLKKYYAQYKDILRLSIMEMREIYMIGHTVIPSKGAEVDIPAQVAYWMGREFPCLTNTRYECNIAVKEDKIALWYQEEDSGDVEYILGPVVEAPEEDIPEGMIPVTLAAGKYAIFETERPTDEEDIAETLRMYARCVFFGWIKEYRERVDLTRLTFERYENGKIYLYVPVKY